MKMNKLQIKLDSRKPDSREMDTIRVRLALRKAKEEKEEQERKRQERIQERLRFVSSLIWEKGGNISDTSPARAAHHRLDPCKCNLSNNCIIFFQNYNHVSDIELLITAILKHLLFLVHFLDDFTILQHFSLFLAQDYCRIFIFAQWDPQRRSQVI